ncbi:hypothetical protein [Larsenimonas salina]|uniref:hypothetical protein n=1 Tax=Larsenimonas salina TaxID=1295565 RepID=UPI0020734C83|nr:hypothetical protein [Larsenimonas salina]MCM5704347.1 hypothetical protein [Larsenimonas salina]
MSVLPKRSHRQAWARAVGLGGLLVAHGAWAVTLMPQAPSHWIVPEGASSRSIVERYVSDASQWPELWAKNKDVAAPPTLHAGDTLSLVTLDATPTLLLERGSRVARLSPSVRVATQGSTALIDAHEPFGGASRYRFVTKTGLGAFSALTGQQGEHLVLGKGAIVFSAGQATMGARLGLYREVAGASVLPDGVRLLKRVGEARVLERTQGVTRLEIISADEPIDMATHLGPLDAPTEPDFLEHAALGGPGGIDARIQWLEGGALYTGAGSLVLLNRGYRDGLEVGQRLRLSTVDHARQPVSDVGRLSQSDGHLSVVAMSASASLARIHQSARPVAVGDTVVSEPSL